MPITSTPQGHVTVQVFITPLVCSINSFFFSIVDNPSLVISLISRNGYLLKYILKTMSVSFRFCFVGKLSFLFLFSCVVICIVVF